MGRKNMRLATLWLGIVLLPLFGDLPPEESNLDLSTIFDQQEALISMRDGVRLHTEIYVPKVAPGPLPFVLERTPYGLNNDEKGFTRKFGAYRELIPEGYIFVFQDVRGRYRSEGEFVMFRDPRDRNDPKAIDESTDTYDTIEWLLKNIPNHNGRAGILGISYGGWLTTMAALDPHPALKAASEQASPADQFLGDDFHHNGAFRLSYGFEYAALMETSKTNFHFEFDRHDTFEWYLLLGPLSNVNKKYFQGRVPTWNNFAAHPNYDQFWQKQAFAPYLNSLKSVPVPLLNVAGWWDQEDYYGPLKIYELLEKKDSPDWNYLVAGPWNHGGWARGDGRHLGKIDFESDTGRYFREKIQAPWFAYWLKEKGTPPAEAITFQTGSNKWESYDEWPPRRNVVERKLYFHRFGKLSFEPPAETGKASDSYISDPDRPVPYRQRPISPTYPGPGWPAWLVEDQRFVHLRPDTLSWETDTLEEDVTVAGEIVAHLFASTSGTDADWVVKVIDVYPQDHQDAALRGYQLMIASEVFRARFRNSFEKPEPLLPNRVVAYTIGLLSKNHCFRKGHRIMVQVQSTWFPLIDRNPQKFVENIWTASEADYRVATQRVYRSRQFPSHIRLPVVSP